MSDALLDCKKITIKQNTNSNYNMGLADGSQIDFAGKTLAGFFDAYNGVIAVYNDNGYVYTLSILKEDIESYEDFTQVLEKIVEVEKPIEKIMPLNLVVGQDIKIIEFK